MMPLHGAKVVIWGWGRHGGGGAAARHCAARGAHVAVLDRTTAVDLGADFRGPWHVGDASHPAFAAADLIVASPAIAPRAWPAIHPPRICPEGLFFAAHRGPVVAVTGTKGKSTTVRMLSTLLQWTPGGNSYEPLLDVQERLGIEAQVVAELSSFQLWYLAEQPPTLELALLTSLSVDHLDWHPDLAHYRQAKLALLTWAKRCVGHAGDAPGLTCPLSVVDGSFRLGETILARRSDLALPGDHNVRNAALAISAALALGLDPHLVAERLRRVVGLPHRLATVHVADGFTYVDDSIATTPEAAMCALAALDGPLAIILGGSDKGADFTVLASAVAKRGAQPILIGSTAPRIAAALDAVQTPWSVHTNLSQAVAAARSALPDGGTVLLSPACASFDWFQGFEDRGRRFALAAASPG